MLSLADLAQTPAKFDAALASLIGQRATVAAQAGRILDSIHREQGDTRRWLDRRPTWSMDHAVVLGRAAGSALAAEYREAMDEAVRLSTEIMLMDAAYTGWSRFILCTSAGGHVHTDRGCRTLRWDTSLAWQPQLSGMDSAEAVEALDEALCSVCYPDAPVALTEYVSKRSQAEAAARAAEKAARSDAKALKTLTLTETKAFSSMDRYDRPETVAAAKALVRKPAEEAACLAMYRTPAWQSKALTGGFDADMLDQWIARQTEKLAEAEAAALLAVEILAAREAAVPGSGQTREASAKALATAAKKAAKDYAA